MRNRIISLTLGCLLLLFSACQRLTPVPAPTVTGTTMPSPTIPSTPAINPSPTPTLSGATATFVPTLSMFTPTPHMQGPYAVVEVQEGDRLNVRAEAGVQARVVAALPPTATDVYLTGASQQVDGARWVEIQRGSDAKVRGWVNAFFLTPWIPSEDFCAATERQAVLGALEQAIRQRDGRQLADLVSPVHGMTVWLWRSGKPIRFDAGHARWVFTSTYSHNWGMHPASGLETSGSFQEAVLPALEDAFLHSHEVRCNERTVPGLLDSSVIPVSVQNYNVFKVLKPGSAGVELDWRIWMVAVEVLDGKPYLTALIHFQWEP
ncbi:MULTISPECIES: hypothetical protein [Anaerolinea]|uniref:hypothetical protein n=1 Tax=Anaerolinea TaxID=233189 RepID=UPI0026324070|nr:hypothetical protein [Anaerolinea thermophila]